MKNNGRVSSFYSKILCIVISLVLLIIPAAFFSFGVSTLGISGADFPVNLEPGTPFIVNGTVSSDELITNVTAGIYNTIGTALYEHSEKPYAYSYDVSRMDDWLLFSRLPEGNYTYCITADDSSVSGKVLLNKKFSVKAAGKSSLEISGANYPERLVRGTPFVIYGTVLSDEKITFVTAGIYNAGGTAVYEHRDEPYTYSYDINRMDDWLLFSKLPSGSYSYKITAGDAAAGSAVLLNKSFTVTDSEASGLKLTGANYPETLIKGTPFIVTGTVSSGNVITFVTAGIYSANGSALYEHREEPYSCSYDIGLMDDYLSFSRLPAGDFSYKITAGDSASGSVVLLNKSFKVIQPSVSNIRISGENYPGNLVKGTPFNVRGTVSSDRIITSVTAGIYREDGYALYERSEAPDAYSYNLSNMDDWLLFSKLPSGKYTYAVYAAGKDGDRVCLLKKEFTVSEPASPEGNIAKKTMKFLDLSQFNEINSWGKMARDVDGVILRVGGRGTATGRIYSDSCFEEYYREAKAAGLHIGCYFFSNALNEKQAVEEADYVLSVIKENGCECDMPLYLDMETPDQYALSESKATSVARAFCTRISENGMYPGIYCSKSFAEDELYASQLSDVTFWIAQYYDKITYNGPYGMWQYSEYGEKSYIDGYVDLDICYYDYPSYIRENGLNGYQRIVKPPVSPPAERVYEIKAVNGVNVLESSKLIYGIAPGTTPSAFENRNLSLGGASAVFKNTVGGKIATGTILSIKNPDGTEDRYILSVRGDVDSNAVLNSSDALMILQCAVGNKVLSNEKKYSADYNGDGKTDAADALAVLKVSVNN